MDGRTRVTREIAVPRPGAGRPEPLLRHVVGAILRRVRLAQRRTLVDVAAQARVSTAYLSEVERGRKEASSEVLAAVCAALGMRVVDLVARAGEELRPVAPVLELSSAGARSSATHAGLSARPRAGRPGPRAPGRAAGRPVLAAA